MEYRLGGRYEQYRSVVNAALAGHGVVWELDENGRIVRFLPGPAAASLRAALVELLTPRFAAALNLFSMARDAYDTQPRRDRDACSNAFDALESVAKEKYGMPTATFGQVVVEMRRRGSHNQQIVGVLESINTLRNKNFGHGMATPFSLTTAEVDLTYLTCVAGILLVVRTP